MSLLSDYARAYLTAGLSIIALTGKRPNTTFHEHGLSDPIEGVPESPEDDALIERVFNHSTTTGVGILIPRYVYVADIDTEEAAKFYMDLAGELPDSPTAKTRNGLHVWFWDPGAHSSVWLGANRHLLLRGEGSYVAAPPSEHPDGGVYSWINPLVDAKGLEPVAFLPQPIYQLLLDIEKVKATAEVVRDPTYLWQLSRHPWTLRKTRVAPDISGLCKAIIEAPDGNQNNVVAWAAMTAEEEGVSYEVAMDELLAAAIKGGHPASRARTTIKSVYRRRRGH